MNAKTASGWIRNNILGFVAIFIALTGTAVALPGTDTVESDDIINGEVRNPDIHDNAVTSDKIAIGQVDSPQLHGDSVTSAKIADGSVGAADVAADSLGAGQIDETSLDSSVLQRRLASGCASGSAIRDVDAAGNVTCEPTGGGGSGGPPTGPAGGALSGTYPNPGIATNAVGNSQLADGSVSSPEIATGAVGSSEVATDAVGSQEVTAGAIGSSELAQGAVTTDKLGSVAVTNANIAPGAVSGNRILDDSVGGEDIFDGGLTGTDVANNSSLNGNDIDESSLNIAVGKTVHDGSFCFGDFDGGTCATMSLTLPRSEHVLVIASGEYVVDEFDDPQQPSDPGNTARMSCFVSAADSLVGSSVNVGEKQTSFGATPVHDVLFPGNFVISGVTGTLSAGAHTFELTCDEDDGAMDVSDARLTAVTLD